MFLTKKVLAIIPARGGSKGIPKKNIRPLAGQPLLAWTILEARKSRYIDRLILSSDSDEIISVAKTFGCDVPFVRPAGLAADETPGIDPVIHALDALPGFDVVVLLQPTSPLRKSEDIDGCIEACLQSTAPSCVSISETAHSPYWTYRLGAAGRLESFLPVSAEQVPTRRQDLPKTYVLNGAVYVAHIDVLRATRSFLVEGTIGYEMPAERGIDIDSNLDFEYAEFLSARAGLTRCLPTGEQTT